MDLPGYGFSVAAPREQRRWDAAGLAYVRARAPLAAGTELLNCYGELSSSKFLSRFGFVPGVEVGEYVSSIKSPGMVYSLEEWGIGGGKKRDGE